MSEIYNKYVERQNPAELSSGIVNAIGRQEIKKADLIQLINELEKNKKLNNATVVIKPQNEWNEDYLQLLQNEVVGGTFSKQYLLHLAEVSKYVNSLKNKNNNYKNHIKWILGIVIFIAVFIAIISIICTRKTINDTSSASARISDGECKFQIETNIMN